MENTLQELYDSEINFQVSTFWDGGFDWHLGDEANGILDSGNSPTFLDAVEDLKHSAIKNFPESTFAKNHQQ